MTHRLLPAIGLIALCACVPRAEAPPPARPLPPAPAQRPAPPPAPPPAASDWRDTPLTPGAWSYAERDEGPEARFGDAGAEPLFAVRCDRARGQVALSRPGAGGGGMLVRTSFTARSLAAAPQGARAGAVLPASDPILDSMVFSRGRFTVEASGAPTLIIPAWPEPARVIEECRR